MKKISAIVIANLLWAVPTAYADGIRSPLGISQAEWNASSAYQNFQCPAGTSRGEGVDMNFTTTRSDDFYFVECNPIPVYVAPTPTVTQTDTPTVSVSAPQSASTVTATPTPAPVIADTSTASTAPNTTTTQAVAPSFDWQQFFNWFIQWFSVWFADWMTKL